MQRRVEIISCKKEYFFKPQSNIGSVLLLLDIDIVNEREKVKIRLGHKIKSLYQNYSRFSELEFRLKIYQRLIQRNKKSANTQIVQLNLSSLSKDSNEAYPVSELLPKNSKNLEELNTISPQISNEMKPSVRIPFMICSISLKDTSIEKSRSSVNNTNSLQINSKTSPLVYRDFELIQKLI